MATYKGIEIDEALRPLIRYMDSVEEYREMLQSLQAVWDNLTLLGQLSGTGTDMSSTRQAFAALTAGLLNNLGLETRRKLVAEMKSRAQVAVDIMVRNLFERTADIGFLATDDSIRACAACRCLPGEACAIDRQSQGCDGRRLPLIGHFREYVAKYSVYSNIILLDAEGQVLVQLDQDNPVTASSDPLIAESLVTDAAYVETFRHTDLLPAADASLIYSFRVTGRGTNTPLGVLCLCFRFENETERIFANLRTPGDWSVLSLLDQEGRVIASSDPYQLPVGARLERVLDQDCRVVQFAGREYLAATRPTQGYQGYAGPGWAGHVMVPIEKAFARVGADRLVQVDESVLAAVMSSPTLFSPALQRIPQQAEKIQRELNRSVWNGNVRQSSDRRALNPAFSKVLLWEISNTGLKTQDVFERSIGNLHETVVSSILDECGFLASLAIDIMDRNLYERSDDCRWWALTTAFREALAGQGGASPEQLAGVLRYINGLYTVYTNLVVFDANGNLVATSNADSNTGVGQPIVEDWVRRTLQLKDVQEYTVSAFAATSLYGGRPTYIYAAAIRAPGDASRVVGGIGIVFDSAPQFAAMLRDALPRNEAGEVAPGCFGVFVERSRRVIASTNPEIPIGEVLSVDEAFVALGNGQGFSNIVAFQGQYYAVGSKVSSGYREYKGPNDSYRNDVVALVFIPLGQVGEGAVQHNLRREAVQLRQRARSPEVGETTEVASFYIGEEWFGIPSVKVVEAIDIAGITPIPGMPDYVRGVLMFQQSPILIFDLKNHLHFGSPVDADSYRQIVVVRGSVGEAFGILVHRLGEIPEVSNQRIDPVANLFPGEAVLAESLVRPDPENGRSAILVVLSAERIHMKLVSARLHLAEVTALPAPQDLPPLPIPSES